MPVASINNIECFYEIHGQGMPLMLIGGVSSDSQSWQPVLNKLKNNFEIIIYDSRATGRTHCPAGFFDIAVLAKDAVSLLEYLKIDKANIIGHSMGGYIAQEIAINYPDKVNDLILESTAAFTSERNKKLFDNLIHMLEENLSYEIFLKEFMNWLFSPAFFNDKKKVNEFIRYIEEYPYKQTLEDFKRQLDAYFTYSSLNRLNTIKSQTLIIRGENDILITEEDNRILAGKICNVKVKKIKDAAHSLHVEEPNAFAIEVVAFLKHV